MGKTAATTKSFFSAKALAKFFGREQQRQEHVARAQIFSLASILLCMLIQVNAVTSRSNLARFPSLNQVRPLKAGCQKRQHIFRVHEDKSACVRGCNSYDD